MKSIIIFGGAGYIGKNLIRRFAKDGYKIIVPYQKQTKEANLRLLGAVGQIIPFHFTSLKNDKLLVTPALCRRFHCGAPLHCWTHFQRMLRAMVRLY